MTEVYRRKARKSKSVSRKFLILGINFYLFYLLLDFEFLKITAFIVLGVSGAIWGAQYVQKKRKIVYHAKSNPLDYFRITKKYLTINRRYILISSIGLVLAAVMISQTILTASSYKQNSLNNFVASDTPLIDLYGNGYDDIPYGAVIQQIDQLIIDEVSKTSFVLNKELFFAVTGMSIYLGGILDVGDGFITNSTYISVRTWAQDDLTILNTVSSIPFNGSEKVLLTDRFLSPFFENNPQKNMTFVIGEEFRQNSSDFIFSEMNYDRKVTEDANLRQTAEFLYNQGKISGEYYYIYGNNLILPQDLFFDFRETIIELQSDEPFPYYPYLDLRFSYFAEIPNIVDNSIEKLISELSRLENSINSVLRKTQFVVDGITYNLNMYASLPLLWDLQSYQSETIGFRALLIMLAMPLVGVSLFLVYFSITLVEQRKARIVGIMKIRGTSKGQIQLEQLGEVIITGLIAGIVGMFLSLPWVILTLRTSGFFEFEGSSIPLYIPSNWYYKLPQIGIILTLDLHFNSIIGLSESNADNIEDVEEKRPPFWQRFYLDLIIFTISTGFWVFIRLVPITDPVIKDVLLYGIGPYLLIGFILSTPLVASRYFSDVIGEISDLLWKIRGGLFALATRNMRKNKYSSSRLVALLLLGMMLSMMAVIIPYSLQANTNENIYYDLGADIVIEGLDISNSTQMDQIKVDGVLSISEVVRTYYYPEFQSGNLYEYVFMGVNTTTFADTAYWKSNYANQPLSSIIKKLDNTTAGISKAQLKAAGLKLDDYLTSLPNDTELQITTTFDYFPKLVSYEPSFSQDGYYEYYGSVEVLTDVRYITENFEYYDTYVYAKVDENVNMTQIKENMAIALNLTSVSINTFEDKLNELESSDIFTLVLASFQSLLVITVIISAIAVVYFSIITLSERNKEIGTLRAIGMIKYQIFLLLVVESLVLVFSGLILGALSGWFISTNLFFLISNQTFGSNIPPQGIVIPYDFIIKFLLVVLVASILAAVFPARSMANRQTGNVLRAE